jgi:hypothetical protein
MPSGDEKSSQKLAPFDQPNYKVNEAAEITGWCPNKVRSVFRNMAGVVDLAKADGRRRKRSDLRIPHDVLVSVWNRCKIGGGK